MRPTCLLIRRFNSPLSIRRCLQRRNLLTLAIETSCDDTSVAVLERHDNNSATLLFHEKITSDNRAYGGVHPIAAHESHAKNLASLVNRALHTLPPRQLITGAFDDCILLKGGYGRDSNIRKKPDFVTVTRGPGMRANLITGMDTAKGLAVAWQVPLLGVNHMQAHALTPRLVSSLNGTATSIKGAFDNNPAFPFLSLLISGGHTMLVLSRSLCDHKIIANTTDLAIGDVIDKCARDILPSSYLNSGPDVMYGRLLEKFTFDEQQHPEYTPPSSFTQPRSRMTQDVEWTLHPPFSSVGLVKRGDEFSYSGIGSAVKRIMNQHPEMTDDERRILARDVMALVFEHLGSRVVLALGRPELNSIKTLVVSGGVASNQFLRTVLKEILYATGCYQVELVCPPPELCTDNAAMIAWTGMEMYDAGWRTTLNAMAMRKWAIDPQASDGGILGVNGWERVATQITSGSKEAFDALS